MSNNHNKKTTNSLPGPRAGLQLKGVHTRSIAPSIYCCKFIDKNKHQISIKGPVHVQKKHQNFGTKL